MEARRNLEPGESIDLKVGEEVRFKLPNHSKIKVPLVNEDRYSNFFLAYAGLSRLNL